MNLIECVLLNEKESFSNLNCGESNKTTETVVTTLQSNTKNCLNDNNQNVGIKFGNIININYNRSPIENNSFFVNQNQFNNDLLKEDQLDQCFENLLKTRRPNVKIINENSKFRNIFRNNVKEVLINTISLEKEVKLNYGNFASNNSEYGNSDNYSVDFKKIEINNNQTTKDLSKEIKIKKAFSSVKDEEKKNYIQIQSPLKNKLLGQKCKSEEFDKIQDETMHERNHHFAYSINEPQKESPIYNSDKVVNQNKHFKSLSVFDKFFLVFKLKYYKIYSIVVNISEDKSKFEISYNRKNRDYVKYNIKYDQIGKHILNLEKNINNKPAIEFNNLDKDESTLCMIMAELKNMLEDISKNVRKTVK